MPSEWYAGDTPSWAQLQEEWRVGYMAEEIEKMSSGLRAKAEGLIVSRKRKRRRHHEGGELSSDRWVNGDYHTPYIVKDGGTRSLPVVTIATAWGGNCDLRAEQLRWNGCAAVALADALTRNGWSVGITAWYSMRSNEDKNNRSATLRASGSGNSASSRRYPSWTPALHSAGRCRSVPSPVRCIARSLLRFQATRLCWTPCTTRILPSRP
jgi:hypothetical protein